MGVISSPNFMFSSQFEEKGVWSTNITDRIRLVKGSSDLSVWVEDEDTEILKENPNQTLRRDWFQISSWGHPLGNAWIGQRCWSHCNGLVCKRQNELPCPGRRRTRLLQGQTSALELPKWFAAVCVALCQMHGRIFALPFSAGPVLPSATLMYQNSKQLPLAVWTRTSPNLPTCGCAHKCPINREQSLVGFHFKKSFQSLGHCKQNCALLCFGCFTATQLFFSAAQPADCSWQKDSESILQWLSKFQNVFWICLGVKTKPFELFCTVKSCQDRFCLRRLWASLCDADCEDSLGIAAGCQVAAWSSGNSSSMM